MIEEKKNNKILPAVGRSERSAITWYLIVVGAVGILFGVLLVWVAARVRHYCRTKHYSVSICPENGFEAFTKRKYKAGSKTVDATEKAKLTSV